MTGPIRHIAISLGGGYLPELGSVVRAIARAAQAQGWQVSGIRDGFDGLLFPERYPLGGVVADPQHLAEDGGSLLGTGARTDPFRLQQVNADGLIEEVDASARVLDGLRERGIDAVVAIVGGSALTGAHALSVMWKLSRRGLPCVCIPKSVENDLEATTQPYGYASVLHHTSESLRHIRLAARDQRRVALVEVPGQTADWLALESGLTVGADIVLIPELPYDIDVVASHLEANPEASLIIVAEGAKPVSSDIADGAATEPTRPRQVPAFDPSYGCGANVIRRQGSAVQALYTALQRRSRHELLPLVLDQLVRAGPAVAADRVLATTYGVSAVKALAAGNCQHVVAAQALDCQVLPLEFVVNRLRTLNLASPALASARMLGICLGDAQ